MTPEPQNRDAQDEKSLLVSYLTLRRIVGGLGIVLPIVLVILGFDAANGHLQASISAYYDLENPRNVLVGTLYAIGFFLLTYRGYEREDDIAGYLSFIFALGVALFPHNGGGVITVVHHTSAAALFLVLAYYSYFLFTKSDGQMTPEKKQRNRIYRICGVAIVLCIGIIGAHGLYARSTGQEAKTWPAIFWLESLALWFFGFSWLVKGETLWRDAGLPPGERLAEHRKV